MRKIYLFCAMGMSTSVLVKKMEDSCKKQNYEAEISAYTVTDVDKLGPEADIILLGPQVGFQLKKIRQMLPNKEVHAIDMLDYGTMNGEAVIKFVRNVLGD